MSEEQSTWSIIYTGVRDTLSDAGLTFERGIPVETHDPVIAEYFQSKNRFVVEETGPVAEAKKPLSLPQNSNDKTLKTSEEQSEDVVVESKSSASEPETVNMPVPKPQEFADNQLTRSQIAGLTSQAPQNADDTLVDKPQTKNNTRRKKNSEKSTDEQPTGSDFLDTQLMDADELK